MIPSVVVRMAGLIGRTKATRKQTSVRPMRAAPHLKLHCKYQERGGAFTVSSAIYANDFILVRATGVIGNSVLGTHKSSQVRLPAIPFISARLPRVDTGALSGVSLPPLGLGFNLCRFLTGWSFPLSIQPRKQALSGFMKWFRSFSCAVFHDRNKTWIGLQHVQRNSATGAKSDA